MEIIILDSCKLFDSEDQAYGSDVIVVCGTYVSGAVGLEEVLVAGGVVSHVLFCVGFFTEVCGWCASEPVGFVAAPAIGEGWDVAFGLQVDAKQTLGPLGPGPIKKE